MPLRVCASPGCPNFSVYRGRCRTCARLNDKSIHRAGRHIYSTKRWQALRRKKLSLTPMCEHPECQDLAEHVHHKHGVDVDSWSMDGLEALCAPHHNQITRRNQLEAI